MKRVLILLGLTVSLLFTTGCALSEEISNGAARIQTSQELKSEIPVALTYLQKYELDVALTLAEFNFISNTTKKVEKALGEDPVFKAAFDSSKDSYNRVLADDMAELVRIINTMTTIKLNLEGVTDIEINAVKHQQMQLKK